MRKHIPVLDGLRGIAILMVLWLHTFQSGAPVSNSLTRFLARTASLGQLGVDLFFVLSGFLITRILLSAKGSPDYFRNFYVRRVLRIFPLYYGFLLLYFVIVPSLNGQPIAPASSQLWFWSYLPNVAFTFGYKVHGPVHFWSLAVEEHFYLLWPFFVHYLNLRHLLWVMLVIVVLAIINRVVFLDLGYATYYFTLTRLDSLIAGCVLAVWEPRFSLSRYRRGFVFGALVLGLLLPFMWINYGGQGLYLVQIVKLSFMPMFFACVVGLLVCARSDSWICRLVGCRFLTFTGKISYGLYVLQGVGFLVAYYYGHQGGFTGYTLLGIGSTYLVAYASFKLYEEPFLKLKRHVEYQTQALS
ncbi:MAG: acyltransferase [Acidobacteriota bacterium]|nr:acyltransferase [Acidobacteriota bacterium]